MIHRGILFWVVAAICTGIGLFMVKYEVQSLEDKIEGINRQIIENQRATHVLKVEYFHLGALQRIERLNERFIHLQPITIRQIGRIDQVPMRRDDGAFVSDNKTTPARGPGTGTPSSTDAPSASATLRPVAKPEAGARAPASGKIPVRAPPPPPAAVVDEQVTSAPAEEPEPGPGAAPPPPRAERGARGGPR
jgi:hypothetical protein